MKRIVIFVLLVLIAAVAGVVVRSASRGTVAEIRELVTHHNTDVREQIRQSYELSPGARVELAGLNGAVNIETSDTNKAEVFIERTASSQEALDRRKVIIEADANSLRSSLQAPSRRANRYAEPASGPPGSSSRTAPMTATSPATDTAKPK